MTLICGLDFETSGLDPDQDRVIEVGACLFDWEKSMPVQILSDLITVDFPIPPEITEVHGITDEMLAMFGRPEEQVFADLDHLVRRSDYAMAHNGIDFDKRFYDAFHNRLDCEAPRKIWIDSKTDIVYPHRITTRNLQYLAAEHSFLNPFRHRAIFDVLTMLTIAKDYDLDTMLTRAQEPIVYVQALVSYADNQKAKDFSFWWNPAHKIWWKSAKRCDYLAERDRYEFRHSMLLNAPV